MQKEIIIKIKPEIVWEKNKDSDFKDSDIIGYDEKQYPVFRIEKNTLLTLYCYKKMVGQFVTLKNAKACAELIYKG